MPEPERSEHMSFLSAVSSLNQCFCTRICALTAACMDAPADALLCSPLRIAGLVLRGVDRPLGVLGSPGKVMYVAHAARDVLVDPAHALHSQL